MSIDNPSTKNSDKKPLIPLRLPASLLSTLSNESRLVINHADADGEDGVAKLTITQNNSSNGREEQGISYPLEVTENQKQYTIVSLQQYYLTMKYLEDSRFTQLTSDLTEAFLNTRGSGNGSSGSANMEGNGRRNRNSNRGGSKAKKQQHHQQPSSGGQATPAKGGGKGRTGSAASNSPYLPSSTFHYNPAGYSSYDGGTSSSSCRPRS